jgi:hypothetical protein
LRAIFLSKSAQIRIRLGFPERFEDAVCKEGHREAGVHHIFDDHDAAAIDRGRDIISSDGRCRSIGCRYSFRAGRNPPKGNVDVFQKIDHEGHRPFHHADEKRELLFVLQIGG